MNPPSFAQKHYPSARHRFLLPSIQRTVVQHSLPEIGQQSEVFPAR